MSPFQNNLITAEQKSFDASGQSADNDQPADQNNEKYGNLRPKRVPTSSAFVHDTPKLTIYGVRDYPTIQKIKSLYQGRSQLSGLDILNMESSGITTLKIKDKTDAMQFQQYLM